MDLQLIAKMDSMKKFIMVSNINKLARILSLLVIIAMTMIIFSFLNRSIILQRISLSTSKLNKKSPFLANITLSDIVFSPTPVDLDLDGAPEILIECFDGNLFVLQSEGILFSININQHIQGIPSAGDIDNDGFLEIIFPAGESIYALDYPSQRVIWKFSVNDYFKSSVIVRDINFDGKLEIIAGGRHGVLYCIDGETGHLIWKVKSEKEFPHIFSPPILADINNDGIYDVIYVLDSAEGQDVIAVSGESGKILWIFQDVIPFTPLIAGDINGDKKSEIIFGGLRYLYVLNDDGKLLWRFGEENKEFFFHGVTLADINDDRKKEIIAVSVKGDIFAIDEKGHLIWKTYIEQSPFRNAFPIVADINGDEILDIIIATFPGIVYVINGKSGSVVLTYHFDGYISETPCVADIDHDMLLELIIPVEDKLYVIKTQGKTYFWYSFMGDYSNCGNTELLLRISEKDSRGIYLYLLWLITYFIVYCVIFSFIGCIIMKIYRTLSNL